MRLKLLTLGITVVAMLASSARAADRVFELRTYTTYDGKLDALKERFRDHTIAIFNRHGMTSLRFLAGISHAAAIQGTEGQAGGAS
jgi:hypothetical protein